MEVIDAVATRVAVGRPKSRLASRSAGAVTPVSGTVIGEGLALVNGQLVNAAVSESQIGETLSLLGTPAGNALKPLLERDPTGETQRIAESLIPASAPRSDHGVWASRQAARALLVAGTRAPGSDLDAQAAAIAQVREAFAQTAGPGLALRIGGAPVFAVDSRARIESEVRWLAIAGTLLVSTLLLVAFGSLPANTTATVTIRAPVMA